ncbi:MAG: hypothetical protein PHY30_02075 [Candidatus Pacebacteria bacterium]|nr:hypothetical protein [Candidatus Paceibacterota bacterium]
MDEKSCSLSKINIVQDLINILNSEKYTLTNYQEFYNLADAEDKETLASIIEEQKEHVKTMANLIQIAEDFYLKK